MDSSALYLLHSSSEINEHMSVCRQRSTAISWTSRAAEDLADVRCNYLRVFEEVLVGLSCRALHNVCRDVSALVWIQSHLTLNDEDLISYIS